MKKLLHTLESGGDLRRRAKRKLREQRAVAVRIESKADTRRLLQELQIHHIELELQNEELKQSKAEVDLALEKYADLYDFAPVGYFSLDDQGSILEVNLTGSAMLGTERSRLTNRRFQLFMAPPSRPTFNAFLARIFAGQDKQVCEVSLQGTGHTGFWADLQARSAVTFGGERKWCRVAVIDVAARKQAEAAQNRIDILAATNRQLEEEITRRQAVETTLKKSEQGAQHLLEQSRLLQKKMRRFSHRILLM